MKKIDIDALGAKVERKIRDATGERNSQLSRERERVLKYYNGELPARTSPGSSSYVSTDVYDMVEFAKADLVETYSGGTDIVRFTPQSPEDVEPARIATDYTSFVFFRQNDGIKIIRDAVHDGLLARFGVVKIFWENAKELVEEEVEGDEMSLALLMERDDIEELEAELDEQAGLYKGRLLRLRVDRSQVRIENVAPEEFFLEPGARSLNGYFHGQRTLKTKAELAAEGFDISLLDDVAADYEHVDEIETRARFAQIDSGFRSGTEDSSKMWVYECYMPCEHDGRDVLMKVIRVGGVTLDAQEVDRSPFRAFIPLPISHSAWGENFAAKIIPYQNARTVLARAILDHTAITTNPRLMVVQGGLTNPKELLRPELGGLVNVTRPDAVVPMQQASLNPFVFQTMEMLRVQSEQTTGISSLTTGTDKNAISKQNSAELIDQMINLSQTRLRVIARHLGEFLKDIFLEVYRLVLENEDRVKVVEVSGKWVEIDPRLWIERRDAEPTLHLSPQDALRESMKLQAFFEKAMQDQFFNRSAGEEGRFNFLAHNARLLGIRNIREFFTPPQEMEPPGPDPIAMKQLELQERQIAVQEAMAQAGAQKMAFDAEIKMMKAEVEAMKAEFAAMAKSRELDRKEMEAANRIDIGQREMAIAESAPLELTKPIISPN